MTIAEPYDFGVYNIPVSSLKCKVAYYCPQNKEEEVHFVEYVDANGETVDVETAIPRLRDALVLPDTWSDNAVHQYVSSLCEDAYWEGAYPQWLEGREGQVIELLLEARDHGDKELMRMCGLALGGHQEGIQEVIAALRYGKTFK